MTSILLALDRIRLNSDPDDPVKVPCPRCEAGLSIHQPDEQSPDRLLGTCEECRGWFLIDAAEDILVRLPDEEELREP